VMQEGLTSLPAKAAVTVCLLGDFRVLKNGSPVTMRQGSKGEQLLGHLALRSPDGVSRDTLLGYLWPDGDGALSGQSLNTLVYSLHRLLGDALAGRPPVLLRGGRYFLNALAGVDVDVSAFDAAARTGDRLASAGDQHGAMASYRGALALYTGDLAFGSDVSAIVEHERLRSRHLGILSRLADTHFAAHDYAKALDCALDLLAHDQCREDAHRMAMRCFVRLGFRSQALRQYRTCRDILAIEFDAVPERATDALYELMRLDPGRA
jgi:DNA-binding SARP family transcriptional activator